LDLCCPPLDVNIREVYAAAGLEHSAQPVCDDNVDWVVDHGIQPQMIRAWTRFVELRAYRRVQGLELIACVILRENSARTSNERGRVRKVSCSSRERRGAVVAQREHWRGEHCIHGIAPVERFSTHDDVERDDVYSHRHIAT